MPFNKFSQIRKLLSNRFKKAIFEGVIATTSDSVLPYALTIAAGIRDLAQALDPLTRQYRKYLSTKLKEETLKSERRIKALERGAKLKRKKTKKSK